MRSFTVKFTSLILKDSNIEKETKTELFGMVKAKLFPDNIGMIVNDFLVQHFA